MNLRASIEHWLHQQWSKRGLFSWLLRPISLFSLAYIRHKQEQPRTPLPKTRPPIIVVGNIIVGGAGKTPVVLALCDYLQNQGWTPGIISRGYGVHLKDGALVGQGRLDAQRYGDEPSLLAQQSGAPIAVHPKRVEALQALIKHYPQVDVVIADDGLQHQALARDIEIIVQDQRGIGNGLVLPAGPLREPPERLATADWLITQLPNSAPIPLTPHPQRDRCVHMQLQPYELEQLSTGRRLLATEWLQEYQQQPCAALAAIGQPQRFFHMLEKLGINLQEQRALPDHGRIPASIFSQLNTNLILITAKDAVKCRQNTDSRIWVVHAQPQFTPIHWLDSLHQHLLQLRQAKTTPH